METLPFEIVGAAHALRKFVTKFTLFFIPVFAFGRHKYYRCSACGLGGVLTPEGEHQLLADAQAQSIVPPTPAVPIAYPTSGWSTSLPPSEPIDEDKLDAKWAAFIGRESTVDGSQP